MFTKHHHWGLLLRIVCLYFLAQEAWIDAQLDLLKQTHQFQWGYAHWFCLFIIQPPQASCASRYCQMHHHWHHCHQAGVPQRYIVFYIYIITKQEGGFVKVSCWAGTNRHTQATTTLEAFSFVTLVKASKKSYTHLIDDEHCSDSADTIVADSKPSEEEKVNEEADDSRSCTRCLLVKLTCRNVC